MGGFQAGPLRPTAGRRAFVRRIERDQWVTQAGQLAASREAAQRPGEMVG